MRTSGHAAAAACFRPGAGSLTRALALPLLLAVAVASGCGGIKPKRTPEGTFESLRKAVVEENYEALWGLLSASARQSRSEQVRAQQLDVEARLPNFTEADKDDFRRDYGISAEAFVNLTPEGAFAMDFRHRRRLGGDLRGLLEGAKVAKVTPQGDGAVLEITISGDAEPAKLTLVKESGLWRVPGMDGILKALDIAGRARRAGDIPADTYRAAIACIRDGALDDLWELFSTDAREWLTGIIEQDQREIEGYEDENVDPGFLSELLDTVSTHRRLLLPITAGKEWGKERSRPDPRNASTARPPRLDW